MSNCQNCNNCEGEKVSSNCIILEGVETKFNSFNELISFLYTKSQTVSGLDAKTLSQEKISDEAIIQLLIDAEVKRKYQTTAISTSSNKECSLDISGIDDCVSCNKSYCEKLQHMVNKIQLLELKLTQLTAQLL